MDLIFSDPLLQNQKWIQEQTAIMIARFPHKINFFIEHGYNPHYFQLFFHTSVDDEGKLSRWRSLVAGRRGGKTISAAWEFAYYTLHPDRWWMDAHGRENNEDAWNWSLSKDHKVGLASLITFRQVLKACGLQNKKDYNENRQDKYFEFERGRIDFRSAEDPSSLVGSGLNLLWIDEAAKLPTDEAWTVVRPCLSDKQGSGIFTTTPEGTNWFYQEFHADDKKERKDISRIEFRSIDNTYFRKEEWDVLLETYHPLAFRREYMASFHAFAGRDLPGDWLHYYTWDDLPRIEGKPGVYNLDYYIGCDPAISVADSADFFALSVIGVPKGSANRAFLIESVRKHINFAEQLDIIQEYQAKYRPVYIGVEQTAYQRVLVQQASRLDSSPNVIGVDAKGSKVERIISMSPSFRLAKITIRQDNKDFIDEWLAFDTKNKNAQDDILDSVEIALRIAGIISEDPVEIPGGLKASVEHPQKWIFDAQPKEVNLENPDDDADADAYGDILNIVDDWYLYE